MVSGRCAQRSVDDGRVKITFAGWLLSGRWCRWWCRCQPPHSRKRLVQAHRLVRGRKLVWGFLHALKECFSLIGLAESTDASSSTLSRYQPAETRSSGGEGGQPAPRPAFRSCLLPSIFPYAGWMGGS